MRRSAAKADTVPDGPSAAVLLVFAAGPAAAGDRALIDYIGFSEDGRYFAFEEFGVQDGSGFPYANIYVVDLTTDRWVSGTPVRVRLDDEAASVGAARNEAREAAEGALEGNGIATAVGSGRQRGRRGGVDGHALTFGRPGYGLDDPLEPVELLLSPFDAESPQDCEGYMGEKAVGFVLTLDGAEIYRDNGTLPNSRGCPMDYRIYAVVAPAEWSGATGGRVAIISSYPFGFEGPDRRFLAVPVPD